MNAMQIMEANKGKTVRFDDCKLRASLYTYDVTFTWHGTAFIGFLERGMDELDYIELQDDTLEPCDIESYASFTVISDKAHCCAHDWSVAR